jgi:hypothetical protein
MTLPANIRTNILVPFPAQVTGAAFLNVAKVNGIWTITPSYGNLAVQAPVGGQLFTDFVVVWDSIAGTYFRLPLSFFSVGGTGGSSPVQRAITAGPVTIVATDQYLNLNLGSSQTITLPGYASRNGVPLNFKDVGMQCTANPLTIAAAGGETIDGFASIPMDTNGEEINLVPFNDGLNTGWFVS